MPATDARDLVNTDMRIHPFAQGCIEYGLNDSSLFVENLNVIACFLSHLSLWEMCARGTEPLIVVEDDINLTTSAIGTLRVALHNIPLDAEFVSLLYTPMSKNDRISSSMATIWREMTGPILTGTQMYYITPPGARKLLKNAVPVVTPVGKWIGMQKKISHLQIYQLRKCVYNTLTFISDEFRSTIKHSFSLKRLIPNSNLIYFTFIACLLVTVSVLVIRRKRCFAPKADICSDTD